MHVVATAGHVDHGKSTLIHALTGQQPDRLEEERARGLSIELGYCWTRLERAGDVAFVDVPGHERFVTTMLAGVGPVPAVMFVVAADDPWMPQAAEHLAVLHALRLRHGLLVVTRSDLAAPGRALERARAALASTSLAGIPDVVVSGTTGDGLDELRTILDEVLVNTTPAPTTNGIRLWADRVFSRPGAGTVVTGTLPAGEIRSGDVLRCESEEVRVRGLQCLGAPVDVARGVARVSVRLGSGAPSSLHRGSTLTTPGAWREAQVLDVRVDGPARQLPREPMVHVGAASVPGRLRVLDGNATETAARLTLARPLPWHVGDRLLLRDPGQRRVWGATVHDPLPPLLQRRGDGQRRGAVVLAWPGVPDVADEVRRRGLVQRRLLRELGLPDGEPAPADVHAVDEWLVDGRVLRTGRDRLERLVSDRARTDPMSGGIALPEAARALSLPDERLLAAFVHPPLRIVDGRVRAGTAVDLPEPVSAALAQLEAGWERHPFQAPDARTLAALGLDHRAVAAAEKAGRVLRVGDVVLPAGADRRAVEQLRALTQPFTTSAARQAWETTRRVALPLLDHLDRRGLTRRLPDDRREVV